MGEEVLPMIVVAPAGAVYPQYSGFDGVQLERDLAALQAERDRVRPVPRAELLETVPDVRLNGGGGDAELGGAPFFDCGDPVEIRRAVAVRLRVCGQILASAQAYLRG